MRKNWMFSVLATSLIALGALAVWAGCNQHPVDYTRASGQVERTKNVSAGGGVKLDILWVIDNSQSMCQEQRQLRDNFKNEFIKTLRESPINFHIAVTTTQMIQSYAIEKIAKPGHVQSTPHPPVGFSDSCRFQADDTGTPMGFDHPMGPKYGSVI